MYLPILRCTKVIIFYGSPEGPYIADPYFLPLFYYLTVAALFFCSRLFVFLRRLSGNKKIKRREKNKEETKN